MAKIQHANISYAKKKIGGNFPIYGMQMLNMSMSAFFIIATMHIVCTHIFTIECCHAEVCTSAEDLHFSASFLDGTLMYSS